MIMNYEHYLWMFVKIEGNGPTMIELDKKSYMKPVKKW